MFDLTARAILAAVPAAAVAFLGCMAYSVGRILAKDAASPGRRPAMFGIIGVIIASAVFALGLGTHLEGPPTRHELIRDWWPTERHYAVAFGETVGFLLPCVLLGIAEERRSRGEVKQVEHFWQGLLTSAERRRRKRKKEHLERGDA